VLPFAHRYGANFMFYSVIGLQVMLYVTAIMFAQRSPFDSLHQRRLFMLSTDNVCMHALFCENDMLIARHPSDYVS
jgi:hypothetical protein